MIVFNVVPTLIRHYNERMWAKSKKKISAHLRMRDVKDIISYYCMLCCFPCLIYHAFILPF